MKSSIATVLLAAGLLAAGGPAPSVAGEGDALTVSVTRVEDRKAVFATVESVDVVAARARIGGTVAGLAIDEGSLVAKGQVIARVEDRKLRLQMAAVTARIDSLKAQRKLAKIALDRIAKLRKSGAASQARLDEARTNLEVVERSLAAMRAEHELVAQQRAEGAVKAPAGGRVLRVSVTDGAVIMPGESVATIAAEAYILRMHLPERHARFIRVGDEVRIDAKRTGRVLQVYPEMNRGRVVADVDVAGLGDFFVGERIAVSIGAGMRDTFVVPRRFLFHRHGLAYVRLKDGGEIVVQTGLAAEGGVEVLSGLVPGDVLLPTGAGR
jgi:membrane fusion protein, multidrug efflux system